MTLLMTGIIKMGYLYCQECTDNTEGDWEVWRNPHELCNHLKESMISDEIATAIKQYDENH